MWSDSGTAGGAEKEDRTHLFCLLCVLRVRNCYVVVVHGFVEGLSSLMFLLHGLVERVVGFIDTLWR